MVSGYAAGTFRPGPNAVRGQIAKIVDYALLGGPAGNAPQGLALAVECPRPRNSDGHSALCRRRPVLPARVTAP